MIKKQKDKWIVKDETGQVKGKFNTYSNALQREHETIKNQFNKVIDPKPMTKKK